MESEPSTSHETNNSETYEITGQRMCKRYCCIPQCESDSRKNPEMSFHKIPKNPELRKKWVRLLKRKGIRDPGSSHRVCSAHFVGGAKTYSNNVPTIFATATSKPRKSPTIRTVAAKNPVITEETYLENTSKESSVVDDSTSKDDNSENTLQELKDKILSLEAQNMALNTKYNEDIAKLKCGVFQMEKFINSDSDFKFYTGFPNYSCFKAFYNYLSPACEHLQYYGSNTAPITSESQNKCGKPRSMSPEQELFLVLIRLRLGLLVQDIAHRLYFHNTSF
ncbi:THAP domain-containing protein 2-like [Dendronephthya gigantea]|uniref:THAP domain-containing protein 2-like n=1 Tax=Dendronephthya gigantea TaxID=151771 RepID=UPI00106921D6|nr:THAP domain-containing protein 2-like [Dendronephthya gigantea]